MALNISPPKQILTHAHWTLGKRKMAKSTGNVVDPFYVIERFGVDGIRYYMLYDGGIQNDADYENSFVTDRYKKGLSGGIGNLTSRIVRTKVWSTRIAIKKTVARINSSSMGKLRQGLSAEFDALAESTKEHHSILSELPSRVSRHFDNLDSSSALQAIMGVIFATNAYMTRNAPWNLALSEDYKEMNQMNQIVFYCAESLRICGILLQPFMPAKMGHLLDMLNVSKDKRMLIDAKVGADRDYGTPRFDMKLRQVEEKLMFPQLTIEWGKVEKPTIHKYYVQKPDIPHQIDHRSNES